ncbi:putative glutathione peroxidase 8 [Crotalus adamanteus]|uniref:Glutathione peroxidase n=1 Tax=Crotalus adamanteus TaxID=8729 RepID=A0AAW1C2H2_CROAD
MSLERYRGKAALVVNVASYCQHTEKNYNMLQELQREFGPYHFTVLAFPCNQFGKLEPGLNDEIIYFAKSNYGVTFPIFSKIKILGSEGSPVFKFLIDASKMEPRWNFWKYLISPEEGIAAELYMKREIQDQFSDVRKFPSVKCRGAQRLVGRPRYPGQRPASAEQRGDASIVYHGAARGALHNRAKERGAGEKAGKGVEILFLVRM